MGWTKRQLIEDAFGELALAGYVFDLSPEELQAALRRLDTMMATWGSQGLQLGHAASATPDGSDLDQDSGIPLEAVEAVYMGLAVRLAASKGKALASSTLRTAKAAFDALMSRAASADVQEQQLASGTPRGAGRKPWRTIHRPFVPTPDVSPLQGSTDGGLTFTGKNN